MSTRSRITAGAAVLTLAVSGVLLTTDTAHGVAGDPPMTCATVPVHTPEAGWCRGDGWTIRPFIRVRPSGQLVSTTLPTCAVEDASSGPVPCGWNIPFAFTGSGLSYWVGKAGTTHYVRPITHTAPAPRVLPMCTTDESGITGPRCVWDAEHTGNLSGRSFVRSHVGAVRFVTHARAHKLAGLTEGNAR